MEFHEKLQELRKQKNLTQEELAKLLFVSRTAVSKWESGRGYPSIDSLKAIADFFSLSVDELLSGKELITVAEKDSVQKMQHMRDLVFGLLDCSMAIFLFLPIFAQRDGSAVRQISLLSLSEGPWFTKDTYLAAMLLTIVWGIATLALQNCHAVIWVKSKGVASVLFSIFGVLLFIATLQPYAACFLFMFVIMKGALLIKRQ